MDNPAKPLIFADNRTDAEKFDPRLHKGALDPSRIPGYSEIVQANDIAKADALYFREQNLGRTQEDVYVQIGAAPQELPVEFQWLRVTGPGGSDSPTAQRDLDGYIHQQGFRLATEDDLTRYGYGFPPSGRRAEDGSIRRGPDVALYVRDGAVSRMWEQYRAEEAARMENAHSEGTFTEGEYSTEMSRTDVRETIDVTH